MVAITEFPRTEARSEIGRSLLGITLLFVGDTDEAADLKRDICGEGARVRIANSLASARRHLALFRPSAVVIGESHPKDESARLLNELRALGEACPMLLAHAPSGASELSEAVDGVLDGSSPVPAMVRGVLKLRGRGTPDSRGGTARDQQISEKLRRSVNALASALDERDPDEVFSKASAVERAAQELGLKEIVAHAASCRKAIELGIGGLCAGQNLLGELEALMRDERDRLLRA